MKLVLSRLAEGILLETSRTGSTMRLHGAKGNQRLVVNNRCIGDGTTIENIANELALKELVTNGFVIPASYLEQSYKLATAGYILADQLMGPVAN